MKKVRMTDEETKSALVVLLKKFIDFCEKYNLTYYLAYGSLLGAVRHGGFIPWDDDIDLIMPRADYNKLLSFMGKELDFSIIDSNSAHYHNYYVKIVDKNTVIENIYFEYGEEMGLFLDIFPMDTVSVSEENVKKVSRRMTNLTKMLNYSLMSKYWPAENSLKNMAKKAVHTYAGIKGYQYWLDEIDQYTAAIASETGDKYSFGGQLMNKDYFEEGTLLKFEGLDVNSPKQYDLCLRETYGDYMQLPPVEQQMSNHDHIAYRKE